MQINVRKYLNDKLDNLDIKAKEEMCCSIIYRIFLVVLDELENELNQHFVRWCEKRSLILQDIDENKRLAIAVQYGKYCLNSEKDLPLESKLIDTLQKSIERLGSISIGTLRYDLLPICELCDLDKKFFPTSKQPKRISTQNAQVNNCDSALHYISRCQTLLLSFADLCTDSLRDREMDILSRIRFRVYCTCFIQCVHHIVLNFTRSAEPNFDVHHHNYEEPDSSLDDISVKYEDLLSVLIPANPLKCLL